MVTGRDDGIVYGSERSSSNSGSSLTTEGCLRIVLRQGHQFPCRLPNRGAGIRKSHLRCSPCTCCCSILVASVLGDGIRALTAGSYCSSATSCAEVVSSGGTLADSTANCTVSLGRGATEALFLVRPIVPWARCDPALAGACFFFFAFSGFSDASLTACSTFWRSAQGTILLELGS